MISEPSRRSKRGQKAYRKGKWAESLSCLILRIKGYKIIKRRYKSRQGEIDIVASKGNRLAFIEVKARPTIAAGAEAVAPQQQHRLHRAAALFHAHNRGFSHYTMSFDLMLVAPWHLPVHIKNAFPCSTLL
ncbi:MAG: YraN family protein [Bdellovibrionales bacterium]